MGKRANNRRTGLQQLAQKAGAIATDSENPKRISEESNFQEKGKAVNDEFIVLDATFGGVGIEHPELDFRKQSTQRLLQRKQLASGNNEEHKCAEPGRVHSKWRLRKVAHEVHGEILGTCAAVESRTLDGLFAEE